MSGEQGGGASALARQQGAPIDLNDYKLGAAFTLGAVAGLALLLMAHRLLPMWSAFIRWMFQ